MKTVNLIFSTLTICGLTLTAAAQESERNSIFNHFELSANVAATLPGGEFSNDFSNSYGLSLSFKVDDPEEYFVYGIELGFYPFNAQDISLDMGYLPIPFEQHMGYLDLLDNSLDFYTLQALFFYRIPITDKSRLYLGGSIGGLIFNGRTTMYQRNSFHEKFYHINSRSHGIIGGPRLGASFDLVKNRLFLNTEAGISYFLLDDQIFEPTLNYRFTTFNIGLTYRFSSL